MIVTDTLTQPAQTSFCRADLLHHAGIEHSGVQRQPESTHELWSSSASGASQVVVTYDENGGYGQADDLFAGLPLNT